MRGGAWTCLDRQKPSAGAGSRGQLAGGAAAPVLPVRRCSISASTQLNLTVWSRTRAAERELVSFGDIVGRVFQVSWHQEQQQKTESEKAEVNKERRAEVVPVLFVWFSQRPACEGAVKERGGPSSSHILSSFLVFDVVEHTEMGFIYCRTPQLKSGEMSSNTTRKWPTELVSSLSPQMVTFNKGGKDPAADGG